MKDNTKTKLNNLKNKLNLLSLGTESSKRFIDETNNQSHEEIDEETLRNYMNDLNEDSSLKTVLGTYEYIKSLAEKMEDRPRPVADNILEMLEGLHPWILENFKKSTLAPRELKKLGLKPGDLEKSCQQLSKYFSDPYVMSMFECHDTVSRNIISTLSIPAVTQYDKSESLTDHSVNGLDVERGFLQLEHNRSFQEKLPALDRNPPASLFKKLSAFQFEEAEEGEDYNFSNLATGCNGADNELGNPNSDVTLASNSINVDRRGFVGQRTFGNASATLTTIDTRPSRVLAIKFLKGQPLGITLTEDEDGNFVVARILQGGSVDKQGLLHPGDIVKEINGVRVRNMEQINSALRNAMQMITTSNSSAADNNSRALKSASFDTLNNSNINNTFAYEDPQANHNIGTVGLINLRIIPTYSERLFNPAPIYLRALFDYNPKHDSLIPSREAGLKFCDGDVLEIVNKEDVNWWQAKRVRATPNVFNTLGTADPYFATGSDKERPYPFEGNGTLQTTRSSKLSIYSSEDCTSSLTTDRGSMARLIPSSTLAENRMAFTAGSRAVAPDPMRDFSNDLLRSAPDVPLPPNYQVLACGAIVTKRSRKLEYRTEQSAAAEFEECDLCVYQEVSPMPPFARKCLVLIGPRGIGKAYLKHELLRNFPETFGTPIPHTSRPMRVGEIDGLNYNFLSDRNLMERDIERGDVYLESGELNGNLYGTRFDSIRRVIEAPIDGSCDGSYTQRRVCLLTLNDPKRLKWLSNPIFTPFVIFVASPAIDKFRRLWKTMAFAANVSSSPTETKTNNPSCSFTDRKVNDLNDQEDDDQLSFTDDGSDVESSLYPNNSASYKITQHQRKIANLPLSSNLLRSVPNSTTSALGGAKNRTKNGERNSKALTNKSNGGPILNGASAKIPPALQLSPLQNPRDSDCFEIFEESRSIKRAYNQLFDMCIVNADLAETYKAIVEAWESLKTQTQWVPTDWVF